MTALKTILIDDEQNNIDNLQALINKYCPQVQVVATANNANDGKALLLQHQPQLLFLDIQMPGKDGFELLCEIKLPSFELIIVTAFDQYAIKAIKFSAIDYLLKPLNIDELVAAIDRANTKQQVTLANQQISNLVEVLQLQKEVHRIALTTLKETRYVKTTTIIRCESSNNYTFFYLQDGEQLLVSKPIYEFEELLQAYGFLRTHQSHLVNNRFVKSWVKEDGGYLLLHNGDTVPVSRNRRTDVLTQLSFPLI
jgi:two-component system, LytTR family, response regulator